MAIDEFVDHVQLKSTGHNDGCGEGADSGTPWGASTYGCPGSGWGDGSGYGSGNCYGGGGS